MISKILVPTDGSEGGAPGGKAWCSPQGCKYPCPDGKDVMQGASNLILMSDDNN